MRYDLFTIPKEVNAVSRTLRFDSTRSGPVLYPDPGQSSGRSLEERIQLHQPAFRIRLPFRDRTVVRGGYGIFYTAAQFDNVNILQLNPPAAAV